MDAHVTGIWCGQIGGGVGRFSIGLGLGLLSRLRHSVRCTLQGCTWGVYGDKKGGMRILWGLCGNSEGIMILRARGDTDSFLETACIRITRAWTGRVQGSCGLRVVEELKLSTG